MVMMMMVMTKRMMWMVTWERTRDDVGSHGVGDDGVVIHSDGRWYCGMDDE